MSQPDIKPNHSQDQERLTRLRAEAKAPYKGLRLVVYFVLAGSALTGGVVFFFRLLAGQNGAENLPNLALQLGVLALMVGLWRWEQKR
jgi:Low psii accumulation1 / Rep27